MLNLIFLLQILMVRECLTLQGKTEKEKAKDKAKSDKKGATRDKVPKILKAGKGEGKGKKKVSYEC